VHPDEVEGQEEKNFDQGEIHEREQALAALRLLERKSDRGIVGLRPSTTKIATNHRNDTFIATIAGH
jgi:hypothetical protein